MSTFVPDFLEICALSPTASPAPTPLITSIPNMTLSYIEYMFLCYAYVISQ